MSEHLSPTAITLLEETRIAALATIVPDGSVHLTAVWYMYSQGRLLIPTVSTYKKVRNIRKTPHASLMIDSRSVTSMRGVSISGRAEIIEAPEAYEINRRIHARYLTRKAAAHPEIGPLFEEGDDTTIAINCDNISYWDMDQGDLAVLFNEPGMLRPLEP